jgi:hypothetical protein
MLDAHACNSNRGVLQVYNNMHISSYQIFKRKHKQLYLLISLEVSYSHTTYFV